MQPEFNEAFVKANIIKDRVTGCWLWTRFYGRRQPAFVTRGPHRRVYNLLKKKWLGADILLIQTCGDRKCVYPDHMEERQAEGNPGAERDSDAWESNGKYKFKKGLSNPKTKLSPADVQMIKALLLLGCPQSWVAGWFEVSKSTINRVASNKIWSHIRSPSKERAVSMVTQFCKIRKVGQDLEQLKKALQDHLAKSGKK